MPTLSVVLCCAHGAAVQALAEALKQNSTITTIQLQDNQIDDEGAKARSLCQHNVVVMASDKYRAPAARSPGIGRGPQAEQHHHDYQTERKPTRQ